MEEKKIPEIKHDWKMKIMVWALWYTICFAAGVVLSVLFVTKQTEPDPTDRTVHRLIFAAFAGIFIEVVLFSLVFPIILGKERKAYKETLLRIRDEGYTPALVQFMTENYLRVSADSKKVGYANGYALYLTDAAIISHDYDRALYYSDLVNTAELFRYNTIGMIMEQVIYYGHRIQIAAFTHNIPACEQVMREAQGLFNSTKGRNPAIDYMIDGSVFEYYFAIGDLARCEALIKPYEQYEELKYAAYQCMGRVFAKKGDAYAANEFFDKAILAASNGFLKQVAENERRFALNNGGVQ